ncbi:hypothetical protein KKG41_04690, partial [Patescibacteria group bacterium]|nr:hypothetical protein [Patescibacteria group bacterium]
MIVNFAENDNKEGGTICTTRRSVKPIYSHLCWLGVILSLGTLILRMTVDMGNAWPSEINNSVIIFGFVFFIITKHVISCQTIKHEKTLLWFLLILLGFNFLWSFSKVEYQDYGLYEFRIYIQYIIIFGTILIVPKIKNIIYGYFVALKKIADDLFSEKKEASEIRKINNKKYTKSKSKLFTWFVGKKSKLLYLLLLVFILGLGLRLINLGELDPAGDEYRHLLAAKHFLADGFYDYPNSHLTTNLVILTQKISNSNNMFFLRSPFAIIGSLSVLLLFFLGRKIHTKVGLIAAYLYACLPLAVGMSRYIRGYEITVFVLLFLTLLLLQRRFIKNLILRSAILIIVFKIFAFFDEDLRTDSTFLLFVMFTGIYLVLHYINRFSEKSWYKYVFLGIAFVGGLMVLPYFTDFQWQTTPELQYMFIFNYITINVMWFLPFIPFLFILIVTVIPFIVSHKNNFILATSFIVLFTVFVYIYFFEAPRRFQVRYLYSLIPYYILLLSAGIHLIFNLIKK